MSTAEETERHVPAERIVQGIRRLRGHQVILDQDLAVLYGVETRALVQAVSRNRDRFPSDFMFQLTRQEFRNLRSQPVTSSWGGRRSLPLAFTEQGVSMLSSVLRSPRAVQVNIEVMRTFVRLRGMLEGNADLKQKFEALEERGRGLSSPGDSCLRAGVSSAVWRASSARQQQPYGFAHRVVFRQRIKMTSKTVINLIVSQVSVTLTTNSNG